MDLVLGLPHHPRELRRFAESMVDVVDARVCLEEPDAACGSRCRFLDVGGVLPAGGSKHIVEELGGIS